MQEPSDETKTSFDDVSLAAQRRREFDALAKAMIVGVSLSIVSIFAWRILRAEMRE